jgi:nucleoside-diphosphate-sugar epimerase
MNAFRVQAPSLLVIGAGDVAWRALPWLLRRFRVRVLCRSAETAARWRAQGAVPLIGDLDQPSSLRRLRGLADYVLHTAPPASNHSGDPRTVRLLAALGAARIIPRAVVYISTTGVYGDCGGARIDETRRRSAGTARAQRRVAAEQTLRAWVCRQARGLRHARIGGRPLQSHPPKKLRKGRRRAPGLALVRAPGIYAADRLPLDRLRAGTPALRAEEDGYTSHIHAEDLAKAIQLAPFRLRGGRAVHTCDQSSLKMGDWFDAIADAFGLPAPRRISRSEAERVLPESLLSFMRESRRLDTRRMVRELRLRLRYASVSEGLAAAAQGKGILPVGRDGSRRSRQ